MATLAEYAERFRNIKLERRQGILQVQLHTRGGPLKWAARDHQSVHAQLGDAFYQIAIRYTHSVLTLELKRRLLNDLGHGFALESLAALSM